MKHEPTFPNPKCVNCGRPIWAGSIVQKQGGPHVLCSDPLLKNHKRLKRPAVNTTGWEIGYVDDNGDEVWL